MPSQRVWTIGKYAFGSVENFRVAPFETFRLTFDLSRIAPVRNSPAGTTTRPPPAFAHASIAPLIASRQSNVPPGFAPNFRILKSFLGNVGDLMRARICGYSVFQGSAWPNPNLGARASPAAPMVKLMINSRLSI